MLNVYRKKENTLQIQRTNKPANVNQLFSSINTQAILQPEKIAIAFGGRILTYDQLRCGANRIARILKQMDASTGDKIGCCVERGGGSLLAILGIFKSGATLIPIDETHPKDRLISIFTQSNISILVSDRTSWPQLREKVNNLSFQLLLLDNANFVDVNDEDFIANFDPEDIAYIIYTSGSTGKPKGVQISHRALNRSVMDGATVIKMSKKDICAQLAELTFDASIWEHLAPLSRGASIVCVPRNVMVTPQTWNRFISEQGITWTYLPPAFFAQWISHLREKQNDEEIRNTLVNLRCILFAGESLPADLVRQWQAIMNTRVTLMNFYGPTETTVLVCGHVVDYKVADDEDTISMGRPFGQNRMILLNEQLQPCALGEVGGLYIGGPQLASGYVLDPALTAKSFIPDPSTPGAILYDSGDLAFINEKGEFVFVGRRDHQVKLRGKRIELEEVERYLNCLDEISAALTFIDDTGQVKRLVACVVAVGDPEPGYLKKHLGKLVPDYMIPHEIVVLSELPVNPNGKIDRNAVKSQYYFNRTHHAMKPDVESKDILECIWQQVLACKNFGNQDHFFDIGGDSLLLFRALSLARRHGYEILDVAKVLANNTLSGWRHYLRYTGKTYTSCKNVKDPSIYPLSPMQREMMVLSEAFLGRNLYHIQFVFESEALETDILEQAIRHVIRCHPIARTVFRYVDGVMQNVELEESVAESFSLEVVNLSEYAGDPELYVWMQEEHMITFDKEVFPLIRAAYIITSDGNYLALTFFHPIFDGWTFSLFVLQVCRTYGHLFRGVSVPDFRLQGRFSDYVRWIDSRTSLKITQDEDAYWRKELQRPLPIVELKPQHNNEGLTRNSFYLEADKSLTASVKNYAGQKGKTLHKVLLAVYFQLFHEITRQDEILIGNTVMGRPLEIDDADQVLGCFINILPIRLKNVDSSFDELLINVAEKMDKALAHSSIANEWHVQNIFKEEKKLGMCWRVIFALDNFPEYFDNNLLHWPPFSWNAIEPFEIALSIIDLNGHFYCYWNYRSDLYKESFLRELGNRYLELLGSLGRMQEKPS